MKYRYSYHRNERNSWTDITQPLYYTRDVYQYTSLITQMIIVRTYLILTKTQQNISGKHFICEYVKQRIDFKILLLSYKALNGVTPAYIHEVLVAYSSAHSTIQTNNQLASPGCRFENFSKRSFAVTATLM